MHTFLFKDPSVGDGAAARLGRTAPPPADGHAGAREDTRAAKGGLAHRGAQRFIGMWAGQRHRWPIDAGTTSGARRAGS